MKIPKEISCLLDRLESKGFEAFVVGGCVRDGLLGVTPYDWDVCTSAYPEEVQSVFPDYFVIPTGLKHGTVTVISGEMQVEITTYRQDGEYLDKRHPESVRFTPDIRKDLERRDFTINAMAYSPKAGLIDFSGGREHLKKKILCCVGDPMARFSEDALRILRGLRFAAVYGLTIDPDTSNAIHNCKDGLRAISAERIFVELKKLIESPHCSTILLEYPDILGVLFPKMNHSFELYDLWIQFTPKLDQIPRRFSFRFSAILDWCYQNGCSIDAIRQSITGLKPDKKTSHHILSLIKHLHLPIPKTLAEIRRFAERNSLELLEELLLLREVLYVEDGTKAKNLIQEIRDNNLCYRLEHLAISGDDLIKKDLSGKEIGAALHKALDAVIEDKAVNTKESLLNFLFS